MGSRAVPCLLYQGAGGGAQRTWGRRHASVRSCDAGYRRLGVWRNAQTCESEKGNSGRDVHNDASALVPRPPARHNVKISKVCRSGEATCRNSLYPLLTSSINLKLH